MLLARPHPVLRPSSAALRTRPRERCFVSLADALAQPGARVHAFVSRSRDPVLNLSIEHYLLQKSAHDSTLLFLYTNRPCIVIGRNQNPWLEVNLRLLTRPAGGLGPVDLVRRRSGGGAVFHDEGNVNWSVISPPANFTRDKHAEMVVRALRRLDVERARVNERHDIVLDQGSQRAAVSPQDTHRTPFTVEDGSGPRPLKVSGSAYKLVRGRALHHGTCLLASPNLSIIPRYLRSPAKPFIKAQGVESVSSPVANIGIRNDRFAAAVQQEFAAMYGGASGGPSAAEIGDEQLDVPEIRKGYDEMKTLDWTYLQTPKFTFSVPAVDDNAQETADVPDGLPPATRITLDVRSGVIHDGSILYGTSHDAQARDGDGRSLLQGRRLHEIGDWSTLLNETGGAGPRRSDADAGLVADWLGNTLPSPQSQ